MKSKKQNPVSQIFSFAEQEKSKMIVSVILSTFSVAFGIIPFIAVGKILLSILDGTANIHSVIFLAIISAVSLILEKILSGVSTMLSHKASYGILYNIRCTLVEKIEKTSMGYVQSRQSGSFKQTMIDLVESLEYALAHAIPEMIPNIILPLIVIVYLFILDWRIALASLVTIIIGMIAAGAMLGGKAMDIFRLTQEGNEKMNETIVEYVNGMEVIKAFNQTASSMKRYENSVTNYRDVLVRWFRHCWPYLGIYDVVTPMTIAFVLPVSGLLLYYGSITLETFVMCLVLSFGIVGPVMKVVSFTDHFNEIYAANTKIQEILQMPEMEQSRVAAIIKDNTVEIRNVSFGYEESEVLHDISFVINAESTTALVGSSGSGKSTIAKLIARFWDTQGGSILIGGVDVKKIPFDQLMDTISFVSQDNFLPNMTIRENILMGKPGASNDEILTAAKRACCDEFISRFPKGYDTKVGDAGDRLSGGERQRIAIARAIIKNAPIVILDEATASIDPENEEKIQMAINELTKNKTLIVIAHRLSTIIDANQIVVMEQGNKIASGNHKELLETCPVYASMWNNHTGATGWSIRKEGTLCGE